MGVQLYLIHIIMEKVLDILNIIAVLVVSILILVHMLRNQVIFMGYVRIMILIALVFLLLTIAKQAQLRVSVKQLMKEVSIAYGILHSLP